MEANSIHVAVESADGDITLSNGRIALRLYLQDGGYVHEFYARDRRNRYILILSSLHKNLIPSSEHRALASPMVSGDRLHMFGVCRESLRTVFTAAEVVHHDEHSAVVKLTGSTQGHSVDCRITIESNSNAAYVSVTDSIAQQSGSDPLVEYVMSTYAFLPDGQMTGIGEEIEYTWSPILRPGNDHVIGDCAFHSPAVIVKDHRYSAALVPDVDLLSRNRTMPAALDLDVNNGLLPAPLLSYGFCGYESLHRNRYCRHDMTMARRLAATDLRYGYHLILDADCAQVPVHKQVSQFLWDKYGRRHAQAPHAAPHMPISAHPGFHVDRIRPNARTAFGMYAIAAETGDQDLLSAARQLKEQVLSAPQDRGLFPTRYSVASGDWEGCKFRFGDAYYHIAECSCQAYWLLKWHRHIQADPAILEFCRRYAGFLLEARMLSGEIPSWYTSEGKALYPLSAGTQSAASAVFLLELSQVTEVAKYATAAERTAKYITSKLLPAGLFQDETLANRIDRCRLECADPHTATLPQSGTAMLWTAMLCAELYKLKGSRSWLTCGLDALDRLCLLQSVWSKPWVDRENQVGLIAQANTGWKLDPELSAEFGRCAMGYAALTGDANYAERAAAALSSSLQDTGSCAASAMRTSASAAITYATYGTAYVHVAQKWAVPLDGFGLRNVEIGRGSIAIDLDAGVSSSEKGMLVFGGMRGNSYKVTLNGQRRQLTREEMARGVGFVLTGRPRPPLAAQQEVPDVSDHVEHKQHV